MNWDEYFFSIADAVSKKSHCLSRHEGAVAVRGNKFITATGYNGPPMGYPHCGDRYKFQEQEYVHTFSECPRHKMGYKSGEGLEICPAAHAELNVLIEAARLGISLDGCILYLTIGSPCRECSKAIVNAGIKEVVVTGDKEYPNIGLSGKEILEKCGVRIRIGREDK